MPNGQPEVVTIRRQPDRSLVVDRDPFVVHKYRDQYVIWVCESREYFTVEFQDGSPFYESQFSTDHPCSGLVRRNVLPDAGRTYKYTVRIGNQVLDPGGEVDK